MNRIELMIEAAVRRSFGEFFKAERNHRVESAISWAIDEASHMALDHFDPDVVMDVLEFYSDFEMSSGELVEYIEDNSTGPGDTTALCTVARSMVYHVLAYQITKRVRFLATEYEKIEAAATHWHYYRNRTVERRESCPTAWDTLVHNAHTDAAITNTTKPVWSIPRSHDALVFFLAGTALRSDTADISPTSSPMDCANKAVENLLPSLTQAEAAHILEKTEHLPEAAAAFAKSATSDGAYGNPRAGRAVGLLARFALFEDVFDYVRLAQELAKDEPITFGHLDADGKLINFGPQTRVHNVPVVLVDV